jgi:hypothetical protein
MPHLVLDRDMSHTVGVTVYRSSPARKYGPLALLAAVQLVIVLVAPSTAPDVAGADAASLGVDAGAPVADAGAAVDPATGVAAGPGAATGGGPVTDTSGGAATAPGAASGGSAPAGGSRTSGGGTAPAAGPAPAAGGKAPAAAAAKGDTSHCVGGRQFDPALDFHAPPCVPGKPGLKGVPNGGATSMGVTKDTIDIIHYVSDAGATVNAILRAQGLYYDAESAKPVNEAWARFINSRYNLHGRTLRIRTFQGTCRTVPPDYPCLIAEMGKLASMKPYAVLWSTTLCSVCFTELARKKVVSFGGLGFSEEFRQALKPYNYDQGMSSTRMAKTFAGWWCHQFAGKNAIFAGGQNPSQDFRKQRRQLGVISTNDPDNERVVKKVLYPELATCGESVKGHEYFYDQDINTAAQQTQAGVAKMNTPNNPATSVLCLCDPVAPQFSYGGSSNNNYWPEVLFATNQLMDTDSSGQSYMGELACPQRQRGCAFEGALGLGQGPMDVAPKDMPGNKVYQAAGGGATPITPLTLNNFWNNWNMMASLLQNTGPNLTPANMAALAPRLGSRGGGTGYQTRRAFENGELSWTRDVRLLYWDKDKKSPYNNEAGSYVKVGAQRFGLGEFPRAAQPPVPTADKR